MRVLRELHCLELVRTEPRRGALEHYYRATVSPWLSDEQWARLPIAIRHKTPVRTLTEILDAAAEASDRGGFDAAEAHVSFVVLAIDEAGRAEIAALLDETRAAALRINAASAARQAEQGPGGATTGRHRARTHPPPASKANVGPDVDNLFALNQNIPPHPRPALGADRVRE